MPKEGLYRGFSSFEFEQTKEFGLSDIELVKLDLLNHIFTSRGDRVMMSMYGTSIPRLVFEPLDNEVLSILEDELREVFEADPRVQLLTLNVQVTEDEHTVTASATLKYVELNITDDFELNLQFGA